MKQKIVVCILSILFIGVSCNTPSFLDETQKIEIESYIETRKQYGEEVKEKIETILSYAENSEERDALKFIVAYMPLQDLADYEESFLYALTKQALQARRDMPWGSKVSNTDFLYFVLPYRSNNEDIDSFRLAVYGELKERVKGLSMEKAALEINHWAHEHVTYGTSNSRTLSPLNTMKKSRGRCGEESVFVTMALRTIGIPARQVYVPRWSHSDDNHSWVEMWADGEWYFMGACEPAPLVNQGWFVEPARRSVLMSTITFGKYWGDEQVVSHTKSSSYVNLTDNYAEVSPTTIRVQTNDGNTVPGAKVNIQVFNYGEFATVAQLTTDKEGVAQFIGGRGDVLIHAFDNNLWGEKLLRIGSVKTIDIVLSMNQGAHDSWSENIDVTPPVKPTPWKAKRGEVEKHRRRLKYEDSLRTAYMSTFATNQYASNIAQKFGLPEDKVLEVFKRSEGNWKVITEYLKEASEIDKNVALEVLLSIPEKDLQDATAEALLDPVKWFYRHEDYRLGFSHEVYTQYLLNPRVGVEVLSSYRSFFEQSIEESEINAMARNPLEIISYIKQNIKVTKERTAFPIYSTPIGVYRLKVADIASINIFFVALARTLGVPAKLDEVGVPFYFEKGRWIVAPLAKTFDEPKMGYITLISGNESIDPEYRKQFTVQKFTDGEFKTLALNEWERGKRLKLSEINSKMPVEIGTYRVTSGFRIDDGSVLARNYYFTVQPNQTTVVPVRIRQPSELPEVKLSLNCTTDLEDYHTGKMQQIGTRALSQENGAVLIWINPGTEPTKHVLAEMNKMVADYNAMSTPLYLLLDKKSTTNAFSPSRFEPLPKGVHFFYDTEMALKRCVETESKRSLEDYPVIMILDENSDVRYLHQGYQIGLSKQIYDIVKLLN